MTVCVSQRLQSAYRKRFTDGIQTGACDSVSFIIFCYSYTVHCLGCGKHKTQSISCKTPTQTYAFLCLYQCISAAHKLITTTTLAQWITIHSHLFVILIHRRKTEWETLKADARPTNPWQIICESMCALFPKSFPPPFFFLLHLRQPNRSLFVGSRWSGYMWGLSKKKEKEKEKNMNLF